MSFQLTVKPSISPLTLQEVKDHLRVDLDFKDDDALISEQINVAVDFVEKRTGRALITQTWKYFANCFNDIIQLKANLQSVSEVKYVDSDGNVVIIPSTDYVSDSTAYIGILYPAYGKDWPASRGDNKSVEITFIAGYGGVAETVPSSIKAAMLLYIGHLYQNRESVTVGVSVNETPQAVDMLLAPYRIYS